MTLLPIVDRELRVAARRPATYWLRISTVFVASLFAGYVWLMTRMSFGRVAGHAIFTTLVYCAAWYAFSAGISASDCISEEKRGGTLGLLFLTDLKGYDVILGKLSARAIGAFYFLLAAMPVAGITVMLGGVTGNEVFRMSLAVLNMLFVIHAIALMCSTLGTQARSAFAGAIALAILFIGGFPAIASGLDYYQHYTLAHVFKLANPMAPFRYGSMIGMRTDEFWASLFTSNFCGWIFLAWASWQVPHSWQDKASAQKLRWEQRSRQWSYGGRAVRDAYRRRMVAANPFCWVISRVYWMPIVVPFLLAALVGLAIFGWACVPGHTWGIEFLIAMMCLVHTTLKLAMASEASRHFEEQRRTGALEFVLACTPLDVPEIVNGYWLALRRIFLWPAIIVMTVDIIILSIHAQKNYSESLWIMAACITMFPADMFALGWVGMWMGISSKKFKQAGSGAILRILVFPWILFYLFLTVGLSAGRNLSFAEGLTLWLALGITFDVAFGWASRAQLFRHFRELAGPQHEERLGFAGRIGRALGKMSREMRTTPAPQ